MPDTETNGELFTCPTCNKELSGTFLLCRYCGTQIKPKEQSPHLKECNLCGMYFEGTTTICTNCCTKPELTKQKTSPSKPISLRKKLTITLIGSISIAFIAHFITFKISYSNMNGPVLEARMTDYKSRTLTKISKASNADMWEIETMTQMLSEAAQERQRAWKVSTDYANIASIFTFAIICGLGYLHFRS